MPTPELAGIIGKTAGIVALSGFIPYTVGILQKRIKPNRASWFVWTGSGVVLAACYEIAGARHTIWVPVSYIIGPLIVALLSIKYGEGKWNILNGSCIVGAFFSTFLLFDPGSSLTAFSLALILEFFGDLPTVQKCSDDPASESLPAYLLFAIANTLNFGAIVDWNPAEAAYTVYMFLSNSVILIVLFSSYNRTKPLLHVIPRN